VSSGTHRSGGMKSGVSAHCAQQQLNDVMCYVMSGKGLTPMVSMQ